MASQAFGTFRYNVVDVARLIQSHRHLHSGAPGKKGLGHITRSGVVMLCAAWEQYVEHLALEAARVLADRASNPSSLPPEVQRELSKHVRESKHELRPLALSGDGWRTAYIEHVKNKCDGINTPKAGPLNDLYLKCIGLAEFSSSWSCGSVALNDFVTVRGGIAHQGRSAPYVSIAALNGYMELIKCLTIEADNCVRTHILSVAGPNRPWNAAS